MSVIWGNPDDQREAIAHLRAMVRSVDPEYPDPRAPRAHSESLVDWVCRFTDARLDSARMLELARELTA
jgi:hypothetical protein